MSYYRVHSGVINAPWMKSPKFRSNGGIDGYVATLHASEEARDIMGIHSKFNVIAISKEIRNRAELTNLLSTRT
jgi:hypothetical protein